MKQTGLAMFGITGGSHLSNVKPCKKMKIGEKIKLDL